MLLSHKTRIVVSKDQEEILNKMSTECCYLYNHLLAQKLKYYEEYKKHLSYYTQQKELKNYKCELLNYDLKREILRGLEANFKSFFQLMKKNKDFNSKPPKFRSSKYFFTISIIQDFIIENENVRISLPKRKQLNCTLYYLVPIQGLTCKRSKTQNSEIKQLKLFKRDDIFYVSVAYEKKVEENIDPNKNIISIDLGKKNLATIYNLQENSTTTFDSKYFNKNLKFHDRRIDELKSRRDKKFKFSNRWKKLNSKVKKIYSKKRTQQNLSLQKISKDLTNLNSNIALGDLTNLKRNIISPYRKLNRQMQNNWNLATFIRQLQYKSELNGNKVIKVNEAWTSKTCCGCGCIHENQTLDDRTLSCDCGLTIDRDVNGAINIMTVYLGDYNPPLETLKFSKRLITFN